MLGTKDFVPIIFSVFVHQISLSNGLAWSADGSKFYYIDTPVFSVDSFDHNDQNGEIS